MKTHFKMAPLLDGEVDGGSGTDTTSAESSGGTEPSTEPVSDGSEDITKQVGEVNFPEGLEEDVKNDPSLKVFVKDGKFNYGNMMKSYVHAQKQMGKDKAILPNKESSEEEWNAFFDKLGRPALDEYDLEAKLSEGQEIDGDMLNGFKQIVHAAGILPKQAQGVLDWFNAQSAEVQKKMNDDHAEVQSKDVEDLKKEWGEAYEREVSLANRALKEFASQEEIDYLVDSGLADDTKLVRLFNRIGKGLSEDSFDEESHGSFGITKEEAQTKVNNLFSDQEGAYLNESHANHKNAVKEMLKLQEIISDAS